MTMRGSLAPSIQSFCVILEFKQAELSSISGETSLSLCQIHHMGTLIGKGVQ